MLAVLAGMGEFGYTDEMQLPPVIGAAYGAAQEIAPSTPVAAGHPRNDGHEAGGVADRRLHGDEVAISDAGRAALEAEEQQVAQAKECEDCG